MRIELSGVLVDDQSKAEKFYTETLGFVLKHKMPVGDDYWLTVVSPENPEGCELLLEPNSNPVSSTFQAGVKAQGLPATMFFVDDVDAEHARLVELGVNFTKPPTEMGPVKMAILDDTCGNLIQLTQHLTG